jgi:hypothetical protein
LYSLGLKPVEIWLARAVDAKIADFLLCQSPTSPLRKRCEAVATQRRKRRNGNWEMGGIVGQRYRRTIPELIGFIFSADSADRSSAAGPPEAVDSWEAI